MLAALVLGTALAPTAASAQDDASYAWGDPNAPAPGTAATTAEDPIRILGWLGAGGGIRLLRNLDFAQDFLAPAYLEFGGAAFLPGRELRHGAGLGISTTLSSDPIDDPNSGIAAGAQWSFVPSYHLLIPLRYLAGFADDWAHLQARVGLPLVASVNRGGSAEFTIGGEVAIAGHFKFLAGLGVYLEISAAIFGGANSTVHPVLGGDLGVFIDYEVLP